MGILKGSPLGEAAFWLPVLRPSHSLDLPGEALDFESEPSEKYPITSDSRPCHTMLDCSILYGSISYPM